MTPATRFLTTLLTLTGSALAQLTANVPCTLDNSLYESATGALSNAKGFGLFVGYTGQPALRRALVRFDVAAALPAGARVLDASLTLSVSRTAVPFDVDVFVHRALASWGEGTSNAPGQEGAGTAATTGDATWLHRFYPNTLWSTPGGDFASAASAVVRTPSFGSAASASSAMLARDVQQMLDNPSANHGWLLKTDEALPFVARRLDSRESTGTQPTLTVTYLLPGQTTLWGTGCPVNGQNFLHVIGGTPTGGNTVQLQQLQGPGNGLAVNLLALALDPAGTPLLPQCSLHLPLGPTIVTNNLLLLDAAGTGSTPLPLPQGFPGLLITSQSATLLPSGGYALSNAAAMLLQ
jgi:hypothetical protein